MNAFSAKKTPYSVSFRHLSRFTALFCFCLLLCAACGREDARSGKPHSAGVRKAETETPHARVPRHKPADHRILVMLGPDYTGRPVLLEGLIDEYGIADQSLPESPNMMTVLSWPDSFVVEKRARLSVLKDSADDPAVTIVLTIGAPEGTARELTRIRAAHPTMKIVTLFAEDESLPLEAVSDFLLDRTVPALMLADERDAGASNVSDAELGVLLLGSALCAESQDPSVSPLAQLTSGLDAARNLTKRKKTGSDWVLSAFVDPDTGLRSRNHLSLEIPPAGTAGPDVAASGGDASL